MTTLKKRRTLLRLVRSMTSNMVPREQHQSRRMRKAVVYGLVLAIVAMAVSPQVMASEGAQAELSKADQVSASHANHRMETEDNEALNYGLRGPEKASTRQSRQYEPSMSTSSTGNFASIATDGGAYVGSQIPATGSAGYGGASSGSSGASSSYANDMAGAYHSNLYHDPLAVSARGYSLPTNPMGYGYGNSMLSGYPGQQNYGPLSSMFGAQAPPPPGFGGLLHNSIFPLIGSAKGFEVSEIICTAVAVAIGAVIVGAPFILLYLFFMNQMNGGNGGPAGMGSSGGAISLTGPNQSTTVNGRKKRHTSIPEALFRQLSPLVDNEQLASTFKALMNSIAKYQV